MTTESVTDPSPSRAYLEKSIANARAAIAFASPAADISYAKAMLLFATIKLERLWQLKWSPNFQPTVVKISVQ